MGEVLLTITDRNEDDRFLTITINDASSRL